MNRIFWMLVLTLFITGCTQESTVVDDEKTDSSVDATDVVTDGLTDRNVADAETADAEKEVTPQDELAELRNESATADDFLAFIAKHKSSTLAMTAISRLTRRDDFDDESKSKLRELIDEQFFANQEVDDELAFDSAKILMELADEDGGDDVLEKIFQRFVATKDELDGLSLKAVSMGLKTGSPEFRQQMTMKLADGFADDPKMLDLVRRMERGIPGSYVENFLTALSEKSTDQKIQGTALITVTKFLAAIPGFKSYLDDDRFLKQVPEETVAYIREFEPDAYAEKIEAMLKRVSEDFADVEGERGKTLGEIADGQLFVIQHLSIGKEAPDILGEDLDGEEFKLSDYRGKVVMLDFWGDW